MIRRITELARDERGTSIIEMAFVVPIFATLLLGVVDVSRAYSEQLQLEQAAYRAVEKVQQYQSSNSTVDTLKSEAADAAGITATTDNPDITYTLYCDGVAQSNYDTTCDSGKTYIRQVNVKLTKTFTPMFPSNKWPGSNQDGTYTLHAEAGLRTQ
jgi:Flp pilus assembly protein TadG